MQLSIISITCAQNFNLHLFFDLFAFFNINSSLMQFLSVVCLLVLLIHQCISEEYLYHLPLPKIISEGAKQYQNQNWQQTIHYLETALSYNLVFINKTNKCINEYRIKSARCDFDVCLMPNYMEIYEDIMYYNFMTHCLGRSLRSGEYFNGIAYNSGHSEVDEDMLHSGVIYDYLFYCYYKIFKNEDALSALRTYSYYSPDSKDVIKNLEFLQNKADVNNIPQRPELLAFNLFINGNKAYDDQNWELAVHYFEQSLTNLTSSINSCKLACTDSTANVTQFLEFVSQVKTFRYMNILECMLRCHDSNIFIGNRINLYYIVLELLHYSLYKINLTEEAIKTANTLKFIKPDDKVTDNYLEHYQFELEEVNETIMIREEIEHVFRQKSSMTNLLSELKVSHKKTEVLNIKTDYSNPLYEDVKLYSRGKSFKNAYMLNFAADSKAERVVIDGLASKDECAKLVSLADMLAIYGDGYSSKPQGEDSSPHTSFERFAGVSINLAVQAYEKGQVGKDLVMLYLEIAERSRYFVETYFNLNSTLYFDYTHLVCRSAKKDKNQDARNDLSHPVHADNCILMKNGSCERIPPAYTSRDYSALVYLSENFEGGEFFFANRETQKPEHLLKADRCGRMCGFSAGAENLHGVLPVKKGQRCAVALWFTLDKNYSEDRIQVYKRINGK